MEIVEIRAEPGLYLVKNWPQRPAHRRPYFKQPRAEHSNRFWITIIVASLLALCALALVDRVGAQSEWDKSSIALTGQCLADGSAEFTVVNNGADMTGPAPWREYAADVQMQSGEFTLLAGATQTWTFVSNGVPVEFQADQRPGHLGNSAPRLTKACEKPTAVTLRTFSATSTGNRGSCAEGNKWRGLACTVTAFTPGYVSGSCDGGLWFAEIRTMRTFRSGQAVTVQGCEYLNWQLASASDWPLRISR